MHVRIQAKGKFLSLNYKKNKLFIGHLEIESGNSQVKILVYFISIHVIDSSKDLILTFLENYWGESCGSFMEVLKQDHDCVTGK